MASLQYILLLLNVYFSEFDPISKAEISELIKTETKMLESKYLTEIELIKTKAKLLETKCLSEVELMKAKCLSEDEIIELIKSNIGLSKIGSGKLIDCPVDNSLFQIVDGTCLR